MIGSAHVIQGNALSLPLPDASVDLICTSPPYFALRAYQDSGETYANQMGSEATPQEFLDALIAATREMVRVLKPTGSIFVNLGDKYAVVPQKWRTETDSRSWSEANKTRREVTDDGQGGIRPKSLMGIPWRYAIRCIDELGLILRAEIIWSKPNGLPESVTDRVRRSHEQWFHLTKQPRYFSAVDEIREGYEPSTIARAHLPRLTTAKYTTTEGMSTGGSTAADSYAANPLGKLPGSVWTVPTQPLTVPPELGIDHFAAFPMEWPRRIIQGWTPNGICTACGEGRRPLADRSEKFQRRPRGAGMGGNFETQGGPNGARHDIGDFETVHRITGYMCGCPTPDAPTTPSVVCDPFGGTGTTALVAKALGRTGITVDLSLDYCRLATWRTNDPRELAAALQVEKPEPVNPDQMELFA